MHTCEYFFERSFVKFFHSPLILLNERMLRVNIPFSPIKEERKRTFWVSGQTDDYLSFLPKREKWT